nr:unnamed protein product [Callosobruchus analis]CAI5832055.1 unnamed protein product [Callosobruchus analis]
MKNYWIRMWKNIQYKKK